MAPASPNFRARAGQAMTQAGSSPAATRSAQPSQRTAFTVSGSTFGAP